MGATGVQRYITTNGSDGVQRVANCTINRAFGAAERAAGQERFCRVCELNNGRQWAPRSALHTLVGCRGHQGKRGRPCDALVAPRVCVAAGWVVRNCSHAAGEFEKTFRQLISRGVVRCSVWAGCSFQALHRAAPGAVASCSWAGRYWRI